MKKCICSGSYDPITVGHLDIIERATSLFDEVIVAVVDNKSKKSTFTIEQRLKMVKTSTKNMKKIKLIGFDGLLAEAVKNEGAIAIVRGLRNSVDYEYEKQMAVVNAQLVPGVETIFIPTRAEYMHISSSIVKELAQLGVDVSSMVPECVQDYLIQRRNTL